MNTLKTESCDLPASFPVHCDITATRFVVGATIAILLVATCLFWPLLAACGQPTILSGERGLWGQVCNAIGVFCQR